MENEMAGINQKSSPRKVKYELYCKYHREALEMKKIVCSNFHGSPYGCNPKYIVEELLKQDNSLDIVWLIDNESGYVFPNGVRTVPFNSEQAIKEIATARVLIDNQMKFLGFLKRSDQFFVQTWHGGIPLKKIGFDNPSNRGKSDYAERVFINFGMVDLMISNSKFCTDMYRRTFGYRGKVIEKGFPRNDLLKRKISLKQKVYEKYNIDIDKKCILYAPTFRDNKKMDAYKMDYNKVLKELGDEWVLMIRLHPHFRKRAGELTSYTDKIMNVSEYDDMQELMAASDILVTDYSNIMFEFALTGKPCVLYATDVEEYRKKRDYYFKVTDLPFPLTTSTEQLIECIKNFNYRIYKKKWRKFMKSVQMKETGKAAKYVADIIMRMVSDKKYLIEKEKIHLKSY